jgi:hypothetical protein
MTGQACWLAGSINASEVRWDVPHLNSKFATSHSCSFLRASMSCRPLLLLLCHMQVQRKLEAAETRAGNAGKRVSELTTQLGGAEDQIVALEGHISVLEEELSKYTQLPQ